MQYIWYTLTVMPEWMLIEFILKVHVRDIYCLTIYYTLKMKSGVVTAYFRSHWWLKNKYADLVEIWIPGAKNTARDVFPAAVFSSLLTKAKKVSCNSFHAMMGWVSAKEWDTRIGKKKQYSDSVTQRPVMAPCRRHYCPIVVKQLRERERSNYIFFHPLLSLICLHFKSRVR